MEDKKKKDVYEIDTDAMREAYETALAEGFQHSPIKVLRDVLRTQGIRVGRGYNDKNKANRKIRVYTDNTLVNTMTGSSLEDLEAVVQAGMEKAGYKVKQVIASEGGKGNPADRNAAVNTRLPRAGFEAKVFANVTVWLEGNPVGSRYQTELDEVEDRDEVKGVNDKYDDETLNCKHCGDYYCTSKFGGECPGIQKDLFDESWPQQEETHAEMVEYWKQSLSSSIVSKGVFTELYTAANNDIDELNAAIADQAESIADSYHGSGEGIGSSDVNHFIMHIGSSLGIDDLFGWNKPKIASDDDMERDKTNRAAKFGKAIRAESLEEGIGFHFYVEPQRVGALVMSSKGNIHDFYEDETEARRVAEQLNAQYGEVDEDIARIRELAGLQETASGGATGAGAIASSPAVVNGVRSRDPSIYGQTKLKKKPTLKTRQTKEDASAGIGRSKKE